MKKETKSTTEREKDTAKPKKGSSALAAASVGRSATEQVHTHSHAGNYANTGTNVSYEGATSPGGGGSVCTGYATGQEATGATIRVNSDFEQNRGGSPSKAKNEKEKKK